MSVQVTMIHGSVGLIEVMMYLRDRRISVIISSVMMSGEAVLMCGGAVLMCGGAVLMCSGAVLMCSGALLMCDGAVLIFRSCRSVPGGREISGWYVLRRLLGSASIILYHMYRLSDTYI